MNALSPAFLFIGPSEQTKVAALDLVRQSVCPKNGCKECSLCTQISEENHYSIVSINPEQRYTLETLEQIFKRTAFSLDEGTYCFFLIHKADFLSQACANSMLKIVEEPPAGYHFIFLAQNAQNVLPTIRSRCVIKALRQTSLNELNTFIKHFTSSVHDPISFQKELLASTLTEQESLLLTDQLFLYWLSAYKQSLKSNQIPLQKKSQSMIKIFKNSLLNPPAPGSSKLFWKTIYLAINSL